MAKADAVKICPSCGTRNKAKWEFCAKCSESLAEVPELKQPTLAGRLTRPPAEGGVASVFWGLLVILVVAAVGVAASRSSRQPSRPDSALFVGPTLPPSLPPAPAAVEKPGARDLAAGKNLLLQGDRAGALARLAQAVADAPDDAGARHAYARALWEAGEREQALAELERATELAPAGTVNIRADYAKCLAQAGRVPESIRQYERLVADQPRSPGFLKDLGALYRSQGNLEAAVSALRRAAEIGPNRPDIYRELAVALDKSGAADEAAAAYRRVLEMKPEADNMRALLADLLSRQKQVDEAVAVLREGIDRDPKSASLRKGLAAVLERAGRTREAVSEYREYLKLSPDAPDAKGLAERASRLERQAASAPS